MPWRLGKHTTTETPAIIAGPFLPEPAVSVAGHYMFGLSDLFPA